VAHPPAGSRETGASINVHVEFIMGGREAASERALSWKKPALA
jgi:hypothetical protein